MLRVVTDRPVKVRKKHERSPSPIPKDAQDRVRAALRSLHLGHGAWSVVAEIIGLTENHLMKATSGRCDVSAELLIRVAFAAGLSVDALLKQKLNEAGRCTACGAKRAA